MIDRLATAAKENSLAARRYLLGYLFNPKAVEKLLTDYQEDFKTRKSGFSKIIRFKERLGDNSQMVILDLAIAEEKKSYAKALEKRKKKGEEKEKEKEKKKKAPAEKKRSFLDRFRRKKEGTKEAEAEERGKETKEAEPTQRTTSK